MATSHDHFPLVQCFISDLNIHINKYGSNTNHPTHKCTSIYEYLLSIDALETFDIGTQSKHKHKIFHFNKTQYESSLNKAQPSICAIEEIDEIMDTIKISDNCPDTQNTNITIIEGMTPTEYIPIIAAIHRS